MWEEIEVSSKLLGHISAGVYRSAGRAIKELVSNAFDARATKAVITTNWPSFDIITCRDDGTGMTLTEFRRLMHGGIGESTKRLPDHNEPPSDRPIIGWLGIGMFAVAQLCHEFKIVSHHRESGTAFQATIRVMDFLREKVDEVDPERERKASVDVGQFQAETIPFDPKAGGTYIAATDMRSAFVRKFRENPEPPLPSRFDLFLDTVHGHHSTKELGDYWQMVWELAIAAPLPYYKEDGPFDWEQVRSVAADPEPSDRHRMRDLNMTLSAYNFEVVVDDLPLRKPNVYPYPVMRRDDRNEPLTGQVFLIKTEAMVYGRPLS